MLLFAVSPAPDRKTDFDLAPQMGSETESGSDYDSDSFCDSKLHAGDGIWQSCWPFFEIDRFEQRMLAIHPKILFDLRSRGRLMWVKRGCLFFGEVVGSWQWAVRGQRFTAVTVIKTFSAPSRPEKFTVAPAECAFPTAIQMRTHFKNVDTQHRAIKFIFHSFVTSVCVCWTQLAALLKVIDILRCKI